MKIMVVGGGGREHAIVKKIKENNQVAEIFVLPSNGGINTIATGVDIKATDINGIVNFALDKKIDYAVVACDDPLVLGLVDRLEEKGIDCFGPRANAARLEGSKAFAKQFMKKYGIPTAKSEIFDNYDSAKDYLQKAEFPVVLKADGLAAGKGVIIASNLEESLAALRTLMLDKTFGKSGETVLIEEFMTGTEFTLLAFTDGETIVPMISSMDHKRAHDNDEGPNTGGMGAIAPSPIYTKDIEKETMEKIVYPTLDGLKKENIIFKGCLYFGLMATPQGVKVVEYNSRFGDPETQAILPLLKTDLLDIMTSITKGRLKDIKIEFMDVSCCCVVMVSNGYPGKYNTGYQVFVPDDIMPYVYFAGVKNSEGNLVTSGGRVLCAYAIGDTLDQAVDQAYQRINKIKFKDAFYRTDIGKIRRTK